MALAEDLAGLVREKSAKTRRRCSHLSSQQPLQCITVETYLQSSAFQLHLRPYLSPLIAVTVCHFLYRITNSNKERRTSTTASTFVQLRYDYLTTQQDIQMMPNKDNGEAGKSESPKEVNAITEAPGTALQLPSLTTIASSSMTIRPTNVASTAAINNGSSSPTSIPFEAPTKDLLYNHLYHAVILSVYDFSKLSLHDKVFVAFYCAVIFGNTCTIGNARKKFFTILFQKRIERDFPKAIDKLLEGTKKWGIKIGNLGLMMVDDLNGGIEDVVPGAGYKDRKLLQGFVDMFIKMIIENVMADSPNYDFYGF